MRAKSRKIVPARRQVKAPTKPYHHGDLRQTLLDGALSLIEEEGIAALSLRELARRIGVSHAAPYHHFQDRVTLLRAIAEQGFLSMQREMSEAVRREGPDAVLRLHALGIAYVRFAAGNPSQFRVMFSPEVVGESPGSSLAVASQSTFAMLSNGLVAAGLSEAAAQDTALLAWSTVHGAAMLWIDRQLCFSDGPADPKRNPDVLEFARRVVTQLASKVANDRTEHPRRPG